MQDHTRKRHAQTATTPECPEISPSYYAAYFEGPSGNWLEVYLRES